MTMGFGMERNVFWDAVKGLAIVAVILIHTTARYTVGGVVWRQMINFAVPMFFFMAGYFCHHDGSLSEFVTRKAKRILVPLVVFSVGYALLDLWFGLRRGVAPTAGSACLALVNFPFGWGYFVLSLFQMFCLYPFLARKSAKWLTGFSAVCFLLSYGYCLSSETVFKELHICRRMMPFVLFLPWVPMFALGVVTKREGLEIKLRWALAGSVLFLLLSMAEGLFYFSRDMLEIMFTPIKTCSLGFALCLAMTFSCVERREGGIRRDGPFFRRLAELGRYSLFVYLSHRFVLLVLRGVAGPLMSSVVISPIAVIVVEYVLVRMIMAMPARVRKSLWFMGV